MFLFLTPKNKYIGNQLIVNSKMVLTVRDTKSGCVIELARGCNIEVSKGVFEDTRMTSEYPLYEVEESYEEVATMLRRENVKYVDY